MLLYKCAIQLPKNKHLMGAFSWKPSNYYMPFFVKDKATQGQGEEPADVRHTHETDIDRKYLCTVEQQEYRTVISPDSTYVVPT